MIVDVIEVEVTGLTETLQWHEDITAFHVIIESDFFLLSMHFKNFKSID